MKSLLNFIFFCSVFPCFSSYSAEGVTKFSKRLSRANKKYCRFIEQSEITLTSITYDEFQKENTKRFAQVCGNLKSGKVVDQPATQAELKAISESLW